MSGRTKTSPAGGRWPAGRGCARGRARVARRRTKWWPRETSQQCPVTESRPLTQVEARTRSATTPRGQPDEPLQPGAPGGACRCSRARRGDEPGRQRCHLRHYAMSLPRARQPRSRTRKVAPRQRLDLEAAVDVAVEEVVPAWVEVGLACRGSGKARPGDTHRQATSGRRGDGRHLHQEHPPGRPIPPANSGSSIPGWPAPSCASYRPRPPDWPTRQAASPQGRRALHPCCRVLPAAVQPLRRPGAFLDLGLAEAGQFAQLQNRRRRHETGPDQAVFDQLGDPRRIRHVGLATC